MVAVEAEPDDLLPGEALGQALAEGVGVLVDHRDRVTDRSRLSASSLPTRPQPTTTTCTDISLRAGRAKAISNLTDQDADRTDLRMVNGMLVCHRRPEFCRGRKEPTTVAFVKRVLVGRPLATTEMEHQRIPKTIALAVFSSDAISSTAYATEEILFVVAVGGSSLALGLSKLIPIGVAVAILLTIVVTSYRQTIFAYPSGGGSYVVSRENLGENPSLIAGASLLVDYILTVAVSISAGVAAIVSIPAFQDLAKHRVALGLILIVFISLANLRGIKESGRIFAVPTYIYIAVLGALVSYGLFRSFVLDDIHRINPLPFKEAGNSIFGGTLGIFILLKGFSSGAVALTGVEAISNGVPAFRRPESKNAAATLVWMGVILGTLFMGVQILAHRLGPYPSEQDDRDVAARYRGVRQRHRDLRRLAVRHRRDPHARRQHRLRRLPPAVVDHRPRRLPAPPARQPGRPPGVLQRGARASRSPRPP